MYNNKSKIRNALERQDQFEDLHSRPRTIDEIEAIKKENIKLEFLINKYNFILNEYQLKYGNELFTQLDRELNIEALESGSTNNNMTEFKKILVENVSLIKEYEKIILEKSNNLQFLNSELNRFQIELEKLVEENKSLREDLENAKEDNNNLYKSILQGDNLSKTGQVPAVDKLEASGNIKFSKTMGMNVNQGSMSGLLSEDVNSNLEVLKAQNDHLLQIIEQTKYEAEHFKSVLEDYKEKYETLMVSNSTLTQEHQKVRNANEELMKTKKYVEEKIKENNNKMLIAEKKANEASSLSSKLEIDNKYIKQELEHFKEMYDDLESRKNQELEAVMRDLNETKTSNSDHKAKISLLETENSDLKFENNKLRAENQIFKYDCDHMTKILEESNFAVKSASEKEKHIDTVIKSYKKKLDEASMEKEKCLVKQRLLEKQIFKISEDYTKLLTAKQSQYENFIDSSKEKFNQIIANKEEDIANLKNDNLSLKIEKDKFFSEYQAAKKEVDRFSLIFREENDKYIKKYEETEKSANRMQNHLHDKINLLVKKVDKLEFEKNTLETELKMYKETDKNREMMLEKYGKNDEVVAKEVSKLRERNEILTKEKDFLEKEVERIDKLAETKIQQMKEQTDLRVNVLENTMKAQKDEFAATENKAFEMLKKQENVSDN